MRRSHLPALVALAVHLASACTGKPAGSTPLRYASAPGPTGVLPTLPQARLPDADARQIQSWRSLTSTRPSTLAERRQRWRQTAELQTQLGNHGLAAEATSLLLQSLRVDAALATLGASSGPSRDEVQQAARLALEAARRAGSPTGMVEALEVLDVTPDTDQALLEAFTQGAFAGIDDRERLAARLGPHAWLLYRGYTTDEQWLAQVPVAHLRDAGPPAHDVLERALALAVKSGDLARARELNRALLATDPWHLPARLADQLTTTASSQARRTLLWSALLGTEGEHQRYARLLRAHADGGKPAELGLVLAWLELEMGLSGDALQRLDGLSAGLATPLQALARAVRALANLDSCDLDGFEAWSPTPRYVGSRFITARLASTLDSAPSDVSQRAVRLYGRLLAGAGPLAIRGDHPFESAAIAVLAASEEGSVRRRAASLYVANDPWAAWVAECAGQARPQQECAGLVQTGRALENPWDWDVPDGWLHTLGKRPNMTHDTVEYVHALKADPRQVADWLAQLDATRLGATSGLWVERVVAEVRAGDVAAARRLLDEHGAVLSVEQRIALDAMVHDVAQKALTPEDAVGEFFVPAPRLVSRVREPRSADNGATDASGQPPAPAERSRLKRLAQVQSLLNAGKYVAAQPLLATLSQQLPAYAPLLAEWALVVAWQLDDADAEAAAAAQLHKLRAGSAVAAFASGLVAQRSGDLDAARRFHGQAMQLRPYWFAPLRSWLGAAAGQADFATRLAGVQAPLRIGQHFSFLGEVLEAGLRPDGTQLLALATDPVKASADPRYAALDGFASMHNWRIRNQVAQAEPAEARKLAARWAGMLDDSEGADHAAVGWLRFVAGEALATPPPSGDQEGELSEHDPLLLLWPARRQLGDELALELFRSLYAGQQRDVLRTVEQLLARWKSEPALAAAVGCQLLVDDNKVERAWRVCSNAWQAKARVPVLGVQMSWLLLNPRPAGAPSVDEDGFFQEAFARFEGELPAELYANHALWLSSRDRHERAVAQLLSAWEGGAAANLGVGEKSHLMVVHNGPVTRHAIMKTHHGRIRRLTAAVALALHEGEVEVAERYLRSAQAWGWVGDDAAGLEFAFLLRDMVQMARADVDEGLVDKAGLQLRGDAEQAGFTGDALQRLVSGYPRARVARFAQGHGMLAKMQLQPALSVFAELARQAPENHSALLGEAASGLLVGDYDRARALRDRVASADPLDPRPGKMQIPDNAEQARTLPAWAQTPEAFRTALSRATIAEGMIEVREDRTLLFVKPSGFQREDRQLPTYATDTVRMIVSRDPRASRCTPATCMDGIAKGLASSKFNEAWRMPIALAAGEGYRALFTGPGNSLLIADVVPAGRQIYAVLYGGQGPEAEKQLGALALVEKTLRPLDAVVGFPAYKALTERTHQHAWGLREQSLLELSASARGKGCPLGKSWREARPAARTAVLREVYLVTPQPALRRRLLRCTGKGRVDAAAMVGLAQLDSDPELHRWGVARARTSTEHTLADAQVLLDAEPQLPLSAVEPGSTRAADGALQLLAGQANGSEAELTLSMLRHPNAAVRGVALGHAVLLDPPPHLPALRQVLVEGPVHEASAALLALHRDRSDATMDAIRRRLDNLVAPSKSAEFSLLSSLVDRLVLAGAAADAPRLERVRKLLDADVEPGLRHAQARARKVCKFALGVHKRMLDPQADVPDAAAVDRHVAVSREPRRRASAATLRAWKRKPLVQLLPGPHWAYSRLQQPKLFLSATEALFERLSGEDDMSRGMVQRMLLTMASRSGGKLLASGSGLDLGRPIECASATDRRSEAFVCVAGVKDENRVRAVLGERAFGSDAGVSVIHKAGIAALAVPVAGAAIPLWVDQFVNSLDDEASPGSTNRTLRLERVRSESKLGAVRLERYATVQVSSETPVVIDREYYLLTDDRLVVFANEDLAHRLLSRVPRGKDRFLAQPEVRRALARWQGGGALESLRVEPGDDGQSTRLGIQMVATSDGVSVRMTGPADKVIPDARRLRDALPGGAASQLVLTSELLPAGADLDQPISSQGTPPPLWLARAAPAVAFGWYPKAGAVLWAQWVGLALRNDKLDAELARRGWPKPEAGGGVEHEGYHVASVGDLLMVAPNREALQRAMASARAVVKHEPAGEAPLVLGGFMQGEATGPVLAQLPVSGAGAAASNALRAFGVMAAAAGEMEFEGYLDRKSGNYELRADIRPTLGDSARPALGVVDAWLTDQQKNALPLPRYLREPGDRAVAYTLDAGKDARALQSALTFHRVAVERPEAGALRVVVQPQGVARPHPGAEPLERSLRSSARFKVKAERIQQVAKRLKAEHDSPDALARAILKWTHGHLRYELQPNSLDALGILEAGKGDCTEYSTLAVAVLRAAGIPARMREGFMAVGNEMVAHAWLEYHDGTGWWEADPTNDVPRVDGRYLPARIMDVLALLSLERVKVVSVDTVER